jgi:hypothetical protein
MNKLQFKLAVLLTLFLFILPSCDEQELLKEVPKDFYSPENSYTKPEHFELAFSYIYNYSRNTFYNNDVKNGYSLYGGTDFQRDARNDGTFSMGDYRLLTPMSGVASYWWERFYKIITNSNVIIDRVQPVTTFVSEEAKTVVVAEAAFFRGFSYRGLANIFGGVPLITEEIKSVKLDFVRATREETWQQAANDLKFAAEHLPEKKNVKADGRVNRTAAYHYLAEVYISLNKLDSAIWAAGKVLDDSNFGLMTSRFGSRKADANGNAYWDLFQMSNQNLSDNKEAIWVVQIEQDDGRIGVGNYKAERIFGPVYWSLQDPDGKSGFIGPSTQNGGRGAGYLGPTDHFAYEVWESDWNNDLRNQEPNMIRDYLYDNPASAYYGQKVSEHPGRVYDEKYYFYPIMSKTSQRGNHPSWLFDNEANRTIGLLNANASKTYHDWYYARVAETYLIRAEAYLAKGDKTNAAADINAVRTRVNAKPIAVNDVTLDYILDERLRELAYEETRLMTLMRLGLVYDRTSRYNIPHVQINPESNPFGTLPIGIEGKTIAPHNNLFPIPYSEIERNVEVKLIQNPGYAD